MIAATEAHNIAQYWENFDEVWQELDKLITIAAKAGKFNITYQYRKDTPITETFGNDIDIIKSTLESYGYTVSVSQARNLLSDHVLIFSLLINW